MKTLLPILGILISLNSFAQRPFVHNHNHDHGTTRKCLSMDELYQGQPSIRKQVIAAQRQVIQSSKQRGMNRSTNGTVKRIPVVVHVIHNDGDEKISEDQIKSQIDVLNADFRRTNSDKTNTPSDFTSVAADTEIEFFLAKKDPDGNATNGINYVKSAQYTELDVNNEDRAMKAATQWNPGMYLNIWVVKVIGSGDVLGYAYYPQGDPDVDGLVIIHDAFGTTGAVSQTYSGGRTAVHEIGHYLGLPHVWGNNGGCNDDDGINDTPNQSSANYGCPSHPSSSCNNNGDMFMNYMDYVNDDCMNMFTQGQSDVMNEHLDNSSSRKNLHTESNLQATGYYDDENTSNLSASFTMSSSAKIGETVSLTDGSTGAPKAWSWTISPDGNHTYLSGSSSSQSPSIKFNATGTYTVTLEVTDVDNNTNSTSESITISDSTSTGNSDDIYDGEELVTSSPTVCGFYHYPPANEEDIDDVNSGSGYKTGHNSYYDKAKAEYYANSDGYSHVFGVAMNFKIASSNTPSSSTFKLIVWENNNGTPGNQLLNESKTYASVIDADNKPYYEFDTPVEVDGESFFVGIEITYSGDDALALNSSSLQSGNTAYEQWDDGDWYPFSSQNTWNQESQMYIFPKVGNEVNVTATSSSNQLCVGDYVSFMATTNLSVEEYIWNFDSETINSSSNVYSSPVLEAGTFTYTVTAVGLCNNAVATGEVYADICTDITELNTDDLNIYPIPASDFIQVDGDNNIQSLELYNAMGKQITQTSNNRIDVSKISNGVYFLMIKNNEAQLVKKVQILRN